MDQHQASDTNHLCSPIWTFGFTFSHCLQLCIYMTSSHILVPNVWKYYQDYFQSRPIHSYHSTSSPVYYYTKVLLSRNHFHWSFVQNTSVMQEPNLKWVQNFRCRCTPIETSGGQGQYYVRSLWHVEECNWECSGQSDVPPFPSRGISWSRPVLHKVIMTCWGM